jgi:hypothetical protein
MAKSELVSPSLLRLQYLLALDVMSGNHGAVDHPPDALEVGGTAEEPE